MLILPFTLRQLEVFASLALTGSFRLAAEDLGISQASVSNQIKTLEDQLGLRLLDRRPGRRPTLTREGLAFHEDMRSFQEAAERLAAHRRPVVGEATEVASFRLLVGQGMFDRYIRPKLDSFFADHPGIELTFSTQPPNKGLVNAVEGRQFDFVLLNQLSDLPVDPNFEPLALLRGGIYGHRDLAAGRPLPLTPEQVSALPFLMPAAGSGLERDALRRLADGGVRPRKVVGHSQYYDVIAAMLERGVAATSFSEAILPPAARAHVIQLMPLEDWQLLFHRRPGLVGAAADLLERFIKRAVLADPNFPAMKLFAAVPGATGSTLNHQAG